MGAPTASLVGSIQIAARSAETGLHKLSELGFDVRQVALAYGVCPLAPVAADDLHAMGYGVVMLVADDKGIPDPVPAFSNLGYNALIKPEALRTFAVAAARRYPYAKYRRMFCEQYVNTPGYAEAYVADQKAFYEAIKSVIPDAVMERRPTTAGISRLCATIAVCDVRPPISVTKPLIIFSLNAMVSAGVKLCATTIDSWFISES